MPAAQEECSDQNATNGKPHVQSGRLLSVLHPCHHCNLVLPQIQELREAIVLPITHRDRFVKLGIKPPKGVLLHGPPGMGGPG